MNHVRHIYLGLGHVHKSIKCNQAKSAKLPKFAWFLGFSSLAAVVRWIAEIVTWIHVASFVPRRLFPATSWFFQWWRHRRSHVYQALPNRHRLVYRRLHGACLEGERNWLKWITSWQQGAKTLVTKNAKITIAVHTIWAYQPIVLELKWGSFVILMNWLHTWK